MFKFIFKISLLLIFAIFPVSTYCDTLHYDDFIKNVIKYHPIANKAELNLNLANSRGKIANGMFDPKLNSNYNDKYYDDKQYFQILSSNIEFPSYLGLSFNVGYDYTRGQYLNPENNTPTDGLGYLGVEANLLQGLLIDERRAAISQAEIFENQAINMRQIEINDLILDASLAYFQWLSAQEYQSIIEESVDLANEYFDNNLQSYLLGDKPAVDTLESFLVLQDQIIMLQSNRIELIKASNNLNNYLWNEDKNVEISPNIIPSKNRIFENQILNLDSSAFISNPILEEKRNKLKMLGTENELKSDKLKPKLKVKYNAITGEVDNSIPNFNMNNYKLGLSFSMPLLFRGETGELEINEIKIRETELEIVNKEINLKNKQNSNFETLELLNNQLQIVEENVIRYKQLLDFEKEKFNIGESSVFLINKRQEKYIFSKLKVIDLIVKYNMEALYNLYLSNSLEGKFK